MELADTCDLVSASPSTDLLGDIDIIHQIPTIYDVEDTPVHNSSLSTLPTDVCSQSYDASTSGESVGLTPDEAAELLKALDASNTSQNLPQESTVSQDTLTRFSDVKVPNTRRIPGRKKGKDPTTGKMRNPSRERLQNELAYLRKKVVELEGELRGLQLSKRSNLSPISPEMTKHGDGGAGARVWQRIAQRQAAGRHAAEEENRRLKTVLEGQIQLAQRLEQVLHKRPNMSVFGDGEGMQNKRLCIGSEDPSTTYELFLSELDGLYARMDGVFHDNGLDTSVDDSLRKAYIKTRMGSEGQEELYAELHDVNILPFDFERVSSAMWYAVKRQYSKNSYHSHQGATGRGDTIAVKYRRKCQRRGVEAWLDAIMAMRCYTESDRLAIVWRSISRGEDELSGMYTDETGWSVLKHVPPNSGINLTGSVMQNCVYVVPKRVDYTAPMHEGEVGLLTNFVINSYEDDVVALSAMVEDILLQDGRVTPNGVGRGS
ncbi:hypothetical protein PR003_g22963 [Phytophthora rubi]|uniref:M96 mating-specific protein family n=1 Tax=Phytophthora rubi TaxID=129364 RepID=A0A6A4D5G6_9STRA|nr:hypothetical protein PR002_g22002 [Phytophthora rubi]KAE9299563.1 hypothetical protein PR003_g22963 [Phytophthora rubi]